MRGFLALSFALGGACGRAGRSRAGGPAAGSRRPPRQRHQPGHAGVRRELRRPRRGRRVRRGRPRPRHTGRAGLVDAGDRQALSRLDRAGDRLRRAVGIVGRLGGRGHHDGVGSRRHGAADEHRLVDPDLVERRGHLEGSAAEGRQRRGGLRRRARPRARPQRRRRAEDGDRRVQLRRARGVADRSRRGDRADAACVAERDRRDEDRSQGSRPRHRGRGDRQRRDELLGAGARLPRRPESHRAHAVDRAHRHRRRALESGSHLPGHRGRDLAHPRALRPAGAPGLASPGCSSCSSRPSSSWRRRSSRLTER